jgi:hypothetical protein
LVDPLNQGLSGFANEGREMTHRNGRERFAVFILRIEGATATRRRVGFTLLNPITGKLGKQRDVAMFGFFVEPQYALDVLKLVGAQAEADNAKLAIEQLRDPLEARSENRASGTGLK